MCLDIKLSCLVLWRAQRKRNFRKSLSYRHRQKRIWPGLRAFDDRNYRYKKPHPLADRKLAFLCKPTRRLSVQHLFALRTVLRGFKSLAGESLLFFPVLRRRFRFLNPDKRPALHVLTFSHKTTSEIKLRLFCWYQLYWQLPRLFLLFAWLGI